MVPSFTWRRCGALSAALLVVIVLVYGAFSHTPTNSISMMSGSTNLASSSPPPPPPSPGPVLWPCGQVVRSGSRPLTTRSSSNTCGDAQASFYSKAEGKIFFKGEGGINLVKELIIAHVRESSLLCADGNLRHTVIDVGANQGQSVGFYEAAYGSDLLRTLFLEPNPQVRLSLISVVAPYIHALVLPFAAAEEDGVANFHMHGTGQDNELGSLGKLAGRGGATITVPTRRLDTVRATLYGGDDADWPIITHLKIDTEGRDLATMRGAPRSLARTRFLLFECSNTWSDDRGGGAKLKNAVALLAAAGFQTYMVGERGSIRLDGADLWRDDYEPVQFGNCLALRPDDPFTPVFEAKALLDVCRGEGLKT
jgi:FkbM family methyltransferase